MIRNSLLALILSLAILGCAPSGGFGQIAVADARAELTVHCGLVCREAGAEAVGYAEFIPSHRFQCICASDKAEEPGLAF
jgi:hypothetical protein